MKTMDILCSAWRKQQKLNEINGILTKHRREVQKYQDQIVEVRQKIHQSHKIVAEKELQEAELMKSLATIEKSRNRTKKLMDEGQVFDFFTAQSQVKAYEEKMALLEEQALLLMEEQDAEHTRIALLADQLAFVTKRYGEESALLVEKETELEPVFEKFENGLLQQMTSMPPEFEKHFQRNRSTHRMLVAELNGKNCGSCGLALPAMAISEVVRLSRPYFCLSCKAIVVAP